MTRGLLLVLAACLAALGAVRSVAAPSGAAATTATTGAAATTATAGAAGAAATAQQQAPKVRHPERAPLLAVVRAGARLVAAGDFGTILLSDDEGRSWRQAASVPTRVTLTALHFMDARLGWAVGHGGIVLATDDGGERWRIAHRAGADKALFSVRFLDAQRGLAVGAFGAALATDDGGRSWNEITVGEGEFSDRHLYHLFGDAAGATWIAAESGVVYRSVDGRDFDAISLPYKGSIWGGMALPDGAILVWGMGGRVLRSADAGASWREIDTGTDNPLTAGLVQAGGRIVIVGLGGTVLASDDGGASFRAEIHPDRLSYTAALEAGGAPLLLSLSGIATSRH
ncbi:MAG: glycosyl hydrolase [Burkholderiaceae bacterium]|nr:glycosyl hydrolase [Burkholderiaceae bacterium]